MRKNDRRRGEYAPPWTRRPPWGLIALILLTGLALLRNGAEELGPPQPASESAPSSRPAVVGTPAPTPADVVSSPGATPESATDVAVAPLEPSRPDRVRIPVIGVRAPLIPLALDDEGWIESPPPGKKNLAGWYQGAVTPGEDGTAVLVGHVDNKAGPVVFYDLGALRKGNRVEVHRKDGSTAVFGIYGIEVFDKASFPADRVYGDRGRPELRVITCGGGFSQTKGYDGNIVVFAKMIEVR